MKVICLLFCILLAAPLFGALEVIGTQCHSDDPEMRFGQYDQLWHDTTPLDCSVIGYGDCSLHVFLRNTGSEPVDVPDLFWHGIDSVLKVSLTEAVAFSKQRKYRKLVYPASLDFSRLTNQKVVFRDVGEPVWWRIEPNPIPPGGVAEAVIRLRQPNYNKTVTLGIGESSVAVPMKHDQPRIESISFGSKLDQVYLYFNKTPARILMDGREINSSIVGDDKANIGVAVCKLDKPLAKASFHVFQGRFADGTTATAGIRAWSDEMCYGIWGSKPGNEGDNALAKAYVNEIAEHNINVQMEMVASKAVSAYLQSTEGLQQMNSLGIRRMVAEPGKGKVKSPFAYFLLDEPDAGDSKVQGVGWGKQVGCLAQGLVERSAEIRKADPLTPQFLNVDMTFKPDNWYIYGQLPDIFAADPYYQERLCQTYWEHPDMLSLYLKATYVYAVGAVARAAAAPKPLHLILNSVRHTEKDRVFRFATPEEKRIEAYYALASGAKGISYWWYTPSGQCYGCGGPEPEAKALWREIGLIGAEFRTIGSLITRSCATAASWDVLGPLGIRSLIVGQDTVVLICVNNKYANDRLGTAIIPVENAVADFRPPSWLDVKEAFEVDYAGTKELKWEVFREGPRIRIPLGTVNVTRLIVVTSDPTLRASLQKYYDSHLAANVMKLTGGSAP